jgi:hypothetical protein
MIDRRHGQDGILLFLAGQIAPSIESLTFSHAIFVLLWNYKRFNKRGMTPSDRSLSDNYMLQFIV